MKAMEGVSTLLRERVSQLREMKAKGVKIVGFVPNGYMPEELVWACGAVPVGLLRGGDHDPVLASERFLPRFLDTFCRAQIGYRLLGEEPLYQMIDLLVVPVTDCNIEAISFSWRSATDVDVFNLAVPQVRLDHGFSTYLGRVRVLKQKLEELTGNRIEDGRLKGEIKTSNRIRELLEQISLTRKSKKPPISSREFVGLNHASYYADKGKLISILESVSDELKRKEVPTPAGPRIMLLGSTLALGDSKVLEILEETGAQIVIEHFDVGLRHYRTKVIPEGDLTEALADRYFMKRLPDSNFRPASRERFEFFLSRAKEFDVDGIIWYSTMYKDSSDIEAFRFMEVLKEKKVDIPMLKVMSDYDLSETGPLRTRIEAFIESITGR